MSRFLALLLWLVLFSCTKRAERSSGIDTTNVDTGLARHPAMGLRSLAPDPGKLIDVDATKAVDTNRVGDSLLVTRSADYDSTFLKIVGIPFGLFSTWDGATLKPAASVFTMAYGNTSPQVLLQQIAVARANKIKLVTTMTGGARANYLSPVIDTLLDSTTVTDTVVGTDSAGVSDSTVVTRVVVDTTLDTLYLAFDMAKWKAKMDQYNTPTIKAAVALAVKDGVLIANSVMDEPGNDGGPGNEGNAWGPTGTMSKARVDSLCRYAKDMFPTLPELVFQDYTVFANQSYKVCDGITSQYRYAKGPLITYRDNTLALCARDKHSCSFAFNPVDGGTRVPGCPIPQTGGPGSYVPNCKMTPAQIKESGTVLGRAGCLLTGFRYDAEMMLSPANRQAFRDVSTALFNVPKILCKRG